MRIRFPVRIGAYTCLGIAAGMAALALREPMQPDVPPETELEPAVAADPLQARLLQCQRAGEAAGSNSECLATWAEHRRRFLGLGRARPAEPAPAISGQNLSASGDPDAGSAEPQER